MKSEDFDRLFRSRGRTWSRRGVVQVVVATLGLGGLSVPAGAKRKKRCKGGKRKCSGRCINPRSDFNNCGTCGNVCGQGQTCMDGTCTGGPPEDCTGQPDLTDCGGGRQCSGGVCATAPTCGIAPDQCASALDCCGNVCDPDEFCPLSAPGNPCRTAENCSDGASCVGFVCQ
jgi:hypothetical protein